MLIYPVLLERIPLFLNYRQCPKFTSYGLLRVLRVSVVKWFSALLSPLRHGEHREMRQ